MAHSCPSKWLVTLPKAGSRVNFPYIQEWVTSRVGRWTGTLGPDRPHGLHKHLPYSQD